jgi:hypothetical protein
MPARQLWMFLTDRDVETLIADLCAREPGLVVSGGRYLRGDPQDLVRAPSTLERRESLPGETRTYLLHPKYSGDIVAHPQTEGPFAGFAQIDEERTDCIVLARKLPRPGELEPARLYAHVTFWRAADKVRKRPMFTVWASQTLKWLEPRLPRTSVEFMRIGPDALAKARSGELKLTYLYRAIAAEPVTDPR